MLVFGDEGGDGSRFSGENQVEVLPVLYGRLDDFAHNGLKVIRESLIIQRCESGVSATDKTHFQVIDGEGRVPVLLKHPLCQKRLSRMGCTCDQNNHTLLPDLFDKGQISTGQRLKAGLDHHELDAFGDGAELPDNQSVSDEIVEVRDMLFKLIRPVHVVIVGVVPDDDARILHHILDVAQAWNLGIRECRIRIGSA